MNIQIQDLFSTYEKLKSVVNQNSYMQEDFCAIQNMFEDKKTKPDANIMVYGVYNAGKSTLINALIGAEIAETGDIPLTDKVTPYKCRNYTILDTPGIDAPKEHENVTKQQLDKADAIIFVVNPLGVVEEEKTLTILMDLFKDEKKVFLVFNEKNELSEENFVKLKDQTRERLQYLAKIRNLNLQHTLKEVAIIKINAQVALIGKLENDSELVEFSGCFEFERQLDKFVISISQEDIYMRLRGLLIEFINKTVKKIESFSSNEMIKEYDFLINDLSTEKIALRKDIGSCIERNKKELYSQIKSWIYNQNEDIENQIQHWILNKSKLIEIDLNDYLEVCTVKIQDKISHLQAKIPAFNLDGTPHENRVQVDSLSLENTPTDSLSNQGININKDQLGQLAVSLSKNIKTEHVVAGLNMVKQYLPSLMKGIGKKTIEKWAGQIVGKTVPIAGAALTIGLALHDIFSGDPETEQLKRQQEMEQRAIERRDQQIEDSATQIADQFATSLSIAISAVIDAFFNQLIGEIEKISQNFDEKDKINSKVLEEILELRQKVYDE